MDIKRMILTLAVCLLIIVGFRYIDKRKYGPKEGQDKPAESTGTSQETAQEAPAEQGVSARNERTDDPVKAVIDRGLPGQSVAQNQDYEAVLKERFEVREDIFLGSEQKGSGYKIRARLTTDAGSIVETWLSEFAKDSDEYKFAKSPYGEERRKPVTVLRPVAGRKKTEEDKPGQPRCKYSLATSRLQFVRPLSEMAGEGPRVLASIDFAQVNGLAGWKLVSNEDTEQESSAVFETIVELRDKKQKKTLAEVLLRKTYTLAKDSYDIDIKLELILSASSADCAVELIQDGPTGMTKESARGDMRSGLYGSLTAKGITVNSIAYGKASDTKKGWAGNDPGEGDLLWAGVMNKFFGAFLVAEAGSIVIEDSQVQSVGKVFRKVEVLPIDEPGNEKSGNVMTRLVSSPIELGSKRSKTIKMKLFVGPKERKLLQSGPYGELNFRKSIRYPWCAFAPLSEGLLWVLGAIYWAIPNYGVAIILLVALVRVSLHRFTRKSQVSMTRMSKLGPEMEKLKKKYGNNREELGRAQMALYKEYKINPISGCLPMAMQMPIWIALYSGLNTVVELRHAPFFWWINDLSGPDNITAYFAGGLSNEPLFTLPLLGGVWGLNILPLLLGVGFFLQQKFTPSAGAAGGAQAEQTRKMMYFMMALFPLMLYSAPSGLNLYIMTSTFVGVIENHYIKKHILEREEAENRPMGGDGSTKIKTLKLKKK